MTDNSFKTSVNGLVLSFVAALVIFAYLCSPIIKASNNVDDKRLYIRSLVNNGTKHESIVPHVNVSAVTGERNLRSTSFNIVNYSCSCLVPIYYHRVSSRDF